MCACCRPHQFTGGRLQRPGQDPAQGGFSAAVGTADDAVFPGLEGARYASKNPAVAIPVAHFARFEGEGVHNGPRMMPLSLFAMKDSTVSLSSLAGNSASAIFRACVRLPFWT